MNRPNIEDYKLHDGGYSQKYITDLEEYITYLETKNKILNKALNDSCKDIEELTGSCPYDIFNHYCFCDNCKDSYIKCWRKFFIDKVKEGK